MLVHGIGALSTVYIFNKYRQRDFVQAKTILADDVVEIKGKGSLRNDYYVMTAHTIQDE